jgi:hypothetical protein
LGRHEEVKHGDQVSIHGCQERLFFKARKPVRPQVFTDNGAFFLFPEAVVVFLVVTAAGKRDVLIFTPDFGGIVDKFRTVITVELQDREGDGISDVREGLENPGMGVIEEGTEFSD